MQIEDFRPGMRVHHRKVGYGTVVWADTHGVTVRYEDRPSPYRYDRDWLKQHGRLLTALRVEASAA